jgi:hypothetical protein
MRGFLIKIMAMGNIKAFIYKNIEWIITVGLIFFAFIFYILGIIFPSFNGLFTNLCAGCATAIIVIWGIEHLRKKGNMQRFAEVNKVAQSDIDSQATMLVWYMANPLHFSIFDYEYDKNGYTHELIRKANKSVLKDILKSDLQGVLVRFEVKDWKHLAMNVALIKVALDENVKIYGNVIPPEILGGILAVRKAFNALSNFSFPILIDLFVKEESEWPINKSGIERNRELRANQITLIARDLKEYFSRVKYLVNLLDELKFY